MVFNAQYENRKRNGALVFDRKRNGALEFELLSPKVIINFGLK